MTYSVKRYFEKMGANGGDSLFRADQPFDAGYTWTMMDNVFHMLDVCGKYRINWMAAETPIAGFGFGAGQMCMYFPVTMVSPYTYPNFDLRVAASGNSETEIRASIVLPEIQGPVGGVGLGYGIIGQATGVTTAGGPPHWIIDTTITTGDVNIAPVGFVQAPAYGGDPGVVGNIHFLKLLIEFDFQTSEGGATGLIHGVQLREYPV